MPKLSRRQVMASSAAFSFLSTLPHIALAGGHGDTLRVAIAGETGDLDLLQNVSTLSSYTVVFDGLIHYGPGGVLEPGLATAWTIAEGGKSIAFDLREGVTFSDGAPFDAETAKWNLERWMGVDDFSWIGIADAYESIEINGPNQITVRLSRPVPAALLELTIVRPVRFLSPNAVDADGKQASPVGTGPWIVESYSSSETVLTRNDNYWGERPSFSRIELKVVPDELARANALRAGELDVIGGDWVAPLSPRRAKALEGEGMTIVAEPGTATTILGYSPKSPMMQNRGGARGGLPWHRPRRHRPGALRRICGPERRYLPDHGADCGRAPRGSRTRRRGRSGSAVGGGLEWWRLRLDKGWRCT